MALDNNSRVDIAKMERLINVLKKTGNELFRVHFQIVRKIWGSGKTTVNAKLLNEEKTVARDFSCKQEYVKTVQVTNALQKIQKDRFHANSRSAQVHQYNPNNFLRRKQEFHNSTTISVRL